MRIGFITQLLWHRYGDLWTRLAQEVDAEPLFAEERLALEYLRDERLRDIPALSFRLAAAQALALQQVDLLIVPDLNAASDATRGAAQDPWIANFPETLATQVSGLPPIVAVPAGFEANLEGLVIETLLKVARDPARVRRAWERHRSHAKQSRKPEPRWQKRASETQLITVIHQPWLNPKAFLTPKEGIHLIDQNELEPLSLQQEGQRFDEKLIMSDQEVIGAARLTARRGGVDKLIFVADKHSGSDIWLSERIKKMSHKPLELFYLQDIVSPEQLLVKV